MWRIVQLLDRATAWSTDWIGPFLGLVSAVLAGLKEFQSQAIPHINALKRSYPAPLPESPTAKPDEPAAVEGSPDA